MVPLAYYLILSIILLCLGFYGLISKTNAIRMLFAIEILTLAANLNLIAFSAYMSPPIISGQMVVIFSIASGVAEVAIGLAIIILMYRLNRTVDVSELRRLKG